MAKRLARTVHVRDLQGRTVVLSPGDEVPKWAAKQVTNPKAFEGGDEPAAAEQPPAGDEPPPRSGRGSGVDAWRAYAEQHDVEVPEGADRDAVIAACEAAGVAVERKE